MKKEFIVSSGPTDEVSLWERRFEKHGWPTMILCLMTVVIWRLVNWAEPKIDKALEGHVEFLKVATETQAKNAANGEKIADQTARLTTIAERQGEKVDEIHRVVVKHQDK